MEKIIRLTESDLIRIVQKVINEQSSPLSITELYVTQPSGYEGSYVTLSNGIKYQYRTGYPSIYNIQCPSGSYGSQNVPSNCTIKITLDGNTSYHCTKSGCVPVKESILIGNPTTKPSFKNPVRTTGQQGKGTL